MAILIRPVREQFEHDRVIRALEVALGERFAVDANVGDERKVSIKTGAGQAYPDLILSSPDSAKKPIAIVEVETGESVNNLEAMYQWVLLAKARAQFRLYVPVACVDATRRLCAQHAIAPAEVWSYASLGGDQIRLERVYRDTGLPADTSLPSSEPLVDILSIRTRRASDIEAAVESAIQNPRREDAHPVDSRRAIAEAAAAAAAEPLRLPPLKPKASKPKPVRARVAGPGPVKSAASSSPGSTASVLPTAASSAAVAAVKAAAVRAAAAKASPAPPPPVPVVPVSGVVAPAANHTPAAISVAARPAAAAPKAAPGGRPAVAAPSAASVPKAARAAKVAPSTPAAAAPPPKEAPSRTPAVKSTPSRPAAPKPAGAKAGAPARKPASPARTGGRVVPAAAARAKGAKGVKGVPTPAKAPVKSGSGKGASSHSTRKTVATQAGRPTAKAQPRAATPPPSARGGAAARTAKAPAKPVRPSTPGSRPGNRPPARPPAAGKGTRPAAGRTTASSRRPATRPAPATRRASAGKPKRK